MIDFIFCIHIHQPVGNFQHVIRESFKRSYLPFLKVLKSHPEIKFSLHMSGILIEWMEENEDEYKEVLKAMVERGQVELLVAGFYEPILAVIPEHDRIGQIGLMKEEIKRIFGFDTKGLWITERVWEPHLPATLVRAGIEYVVVDDYHFFKAGLEEDEVDGYFLTDEGMDLIRVFPGSERLRYLIPFKPVEEIKEYFVELNKRSRGERHTPLSVFADDGEKFGIWPGTYKHVFEDGWLDGFLKMLEKESHWLKTVTFSEYLSQNEPKGRAYLPTASYREMEEWALPSDASHAFSSLYKEVSGLKDGKRILKFLKGGFWRNFLARYPESNWMHKRMVELSQKVFEIGTDIKRYHLHEKSNVPALYRELQSLLFKAQCNDAYWHGVFGGLYLPHLRSAIYESMIKAEGLLMGLRQIVSMERDSQGGLSYTSVDSATDVELYDIDCDARDEIRITTPFLDVFISPHNGGSIFELDYKEKSYNLTNIVSRHKEPYHNDLQELAEETYASGIESIHETIKAKEGLGYSPVFDNYRRGLFHERFFMYDMYDLSPEDMMMGVVEDCGDFLKGEYSFNKEVIERDGVYSLTLFREGLVSGEAMRVEKTIEVDLKGAGIRVVYTISNTGDKPVEAKFAPEMNLLLGFEDKHTPSDHGILNSFELIERWLGLKVRLDMEPETRLYTYPVESFSLSEGGVEKVLQAICIVPLFDLSTLRGAKSTQISVEMRFSSTGD